MAQANRGLAESSILATRTKTGVGNRNGLGRHKQLVDPEPSEKQSSLDHHPVKER